MYRFQARGITYFEFSEIMVDKAGLNIRSRSVSINVLGPAQTGVEYEVETSAVSLEFLAKLVLLQTGSSIKNKTNQDSSTKKKKNKKQKITAS